MGEEHGNPRYIVDLIEKVVRVSVESARLVAQIDGEARLEAAPPEVPASIWGEEEVEEALRFTRFLPVYSLRAACGKFGRGEEVEPEGWVEVEGSREGRIVLAEHRGAEDPDGGGAYSIKRYHGVKATAPDGSWRHERIVLEPLNAEFASIEIPAESAGEFRVVAEWVERVRATI